MSVEGKGSQKDSEIFSSIEPVLLSCVLTVTPFLRLYKLMDTSPLHVLLLLFPTACSPNPVPKLSSVLLCLFILHKFASRTEL